MSNPIDNYPAIIALEKDIGVQLQKLNFKKNKMALKHKREYYWTNYLRQSQDGQFVHIASVTIFCPQPKADEEFYLAPMAATIDAGVEFRAVIPAGYRPKEIRLEEKLQSHECTFQLPNHMFESASEKLLESAKFDVPKFRRMVILPRSDDRTERIDELIEYFNECSASFFSQFVYPFPLDQIELSDIENFSASKTWKFCNNFETSPVLIAGAAEAYWEIENRPDLSQRFKELRRWIYNNPPTNFVPFEQ